MQWISCNGKTCQISLLCSRPGVQTQKRRDVTDAAALVGSQGSLPPKRPRSFYICISTVPPGESRPSRPGVQTRKKAGRDGCGGTGGSQGSLPPKRPRSFYFHGSTWREPFGGGTKVGSRQFYDYVTGRNSHLEFSSGMTSC